MAGVEQNRYKTNNGCTKHLPQTGHIVTRKGSSQVIFFIVTYEYLVLQRGMCHINLML